MQISILGSLTDRSPVDTCVSQLAELRDEGFRRVWLSQLPSEPDLLTVLAVALREVDTIEVGSAVLPIQNQHPMLMAQRALTLSLIGGGRFSLGLGLTHRLVTEGMWGIAWDRNVRRMREYLDGLQPLLNGQAADASGELLTTRGALQFSAPAPPVYLAALGPQLLRLAGRRTAGTLTWMTGVKTLAEHVGPTLRQAAADAGRPDGEVRVVAGLPVSVTDDPGGARAHAARQFAVYGKLPSYRAMLDREGYAGPEDAAIIGDEDTVTQRLGELRAAGVDEFTAAVFDPTPEGRARTRALLAAL
ncbi:TIGR03564 family F420-dependent LLM class oxidoreductase [Mycolicibacterium litorale]|uniref:TIGR03564 family F420-dependent LLM class oxidoreductase n=1 Tax=Mycolicibacterium litorale TaxID=758802 RepID=UPI003CF5196C